MTRRDFSASAAALLAAQTRLLAAEPISDIIKDLLELTRAEVDDEADSEGNEQAIAELVNRKTAYSREQKNGKKESKQSTVVWVLKRKQHRAVYAAKANIELQPAITLGAVKHANY